MFDSKSEILLSKDENFCKTYEIKDGVVYLKEYSESGRIGSFELAPWMLKKIIKDIEANKKA